MKYVLITITIFQENPLSYATKVECPNGGNKTTNFIGGSTNNNNGGQLSPGFNLATSFQIQANSAQPNCLPFFR